jgi:hypothetical protein
MQTVLTTRPSNNHTIRADLLHGGLCGWQQLWSRHHAVYEAQLQRLLRAGQLGELQQRARPARACSCCARYSLEAPQYITKRRIPALQAYVT